MCSRWTSLLRAGLAAARIHTHLDQHTQAAAQLVRLTTVVSSSFYVGLDREFDGVVSKEIFVFLSMGVLQYSVGLTTVVS